jgi:hypothetical protein
MRCGPICGCLSANARIRSSTTAGPAPAAEHPDSESDRLEYDFGRAGHVADGEGRDADNAGLSAGRRRNGGDRRREPSRPVDSDRRDLERLPALPPAGFCGFDKRSSFCGQACGKGVGILGSTRRRPQRRLRPPPSSSLPIFERSILPIGQRFRVRRAARGISWSGLHFSAPVRRSLEERSEWWPDRPAQGVTDRPGGGRRPEGGTPSTRPRRRQHTHELGNPRLQRRYLPALRHGVDQRRARTRPHARCQAPTHHNRHQNQPRNPSSSGASS